MGRRVKKSGSNFREKPDVAKSATKTNAGGKAATAEPPKTEEPKTPESSPSNSGPKWVGSEPGSTARTASPSNDPDWYSLDLPMLMDAASMPYSYPMGDTIDMYSGAGSAGQVSFGDLKERTSVPGICSLVTKMTIGHSRTKLDAANVCANAFYTHVRYVNSGRKNYDPADLMIYAMTISDIISFIMWCQRLYGYMFTYSQRNKYISRALVEANHVNADDLRNNLANFRYWLNAFINKVSAFVVPANIAIFKRRAFLFQGYYLENPDGNIKDQLYQMVPDGFYNFALASNGAGMLSYKRIDRTGAFLNVSDLITMGEAMLAPIWGDEDFGLMSGDILKAYEGNIIGLAPLAADYMVLPIHDKYVLSQFKNATVMPTYTNAEAGFTYSVDGLDFFSGDINQDLHGNLVCSEIIAANNTDSAEYQRRVYGAAVMSKICSVETPQPTPADTIEATRLMLNSELITAKHNNIPEPMGELICGDAIITRVIYSSYYTDANAILHSKRDDVRYSVIELDAGGLPTSAEFETLSLNAMFWYAPILYSSTEGAGGSVSHLRVRSNVDNYTLIGYNELKKMHECALLSLFYVPGVAKMISNA